MLSLHGCFVTNLSFLRETKNGRMVSSALAEGMSLSSSTRMAWLEERAKMKRWLQFDVRSFILWVALLALILGLWLDHRRSAIASESRQAKRGDPQVFPPIEVEAEGTLCALALEPRNEVGEKPLAIVAVKALAPYERQAAAYEAALAKAIGYRPTRDIPRYLFYLAERTEVRADPDAPLDWRLISNSVYAMKLAARYAALPEEIADEAYIVPGVLTMPMPFTGSTSSFESLALHSKVPQRQKRPESQHNEKNVGNHLGGIPQWAKYKMVRFFDLSAQPGKSYRYRVAVVLEDPNRPRDLTAEPDKSILDVSVVQRLEERESEDEEYFKKTGKRRRTYYIQTDWSEPSNTVTVAQPDPAGGKGITVRQKLLSPEDQEHSGSETFRLPKSRDTVFRNYGFTHTHYIHFAKDGTYRRIDRQHMGVSECDRGKWTQDASGRIELRSTTRGNRLRHLRHVHFVPVSHRGFVLLASTDDPFMVDTTPKDVKKTADRSFGENAPPAMVFVLTAFDEVEKEMRTTQPFIFFPELNQGCVAE